MRTVMLGLMLVLIAAGSAFAQGYEYTTSGLEYQSTVPVEAGIDVQGLMRLETGLTALGQVYVEGVYYDDLFAYWVGTYNGGEYYYDSYDGYWKPGPVTYRNATLIFQEEILEGWTRQFGQYLDNDHFFGRDGVLYQRIKVERGRKRDTSRSRRVVYSYFVNMATGERSDNEGSAYRIIGDEEAGERIIEEVMLDREVELAQLVVDNPAYPQWDDGAMEPPTVVVVPDETVLVEGQNLLEIIEGEIGPLTVDADATGSDEGSEES
jgi:hypothetical protein